MLYAVAGSQGSGKSSVLSSLEEIGYEVITRKVSRSILADWNVTLEEVNTDLELSLKFQDEIVERKYADERDAIGSDRPVFTERTYMDSFVYYLFTFGCQNSMSERISKYHELCSMRTTQSYKSVFVLPSGRFETVADGVRGTNPQYVESVDMLINHYINEAAQNVHHAEEASIDGRVDEVINMVNQYKN